MDMVFWFFAFWIVFFIPWLPVIIWVVLLVLCFVFSIRYFVLKKSSKEAMFLLLLLLVTCSYPAFRVYSSWARDKKIENAEIPRVLERGRVIQGLELPAGTTLRYIAAEHEFSDEDIEEISFQSDFSWGDLRVNRINRFISYSLFHYYERIKSDIDNNIISVDLENNSIIDGWWCERGPVAFRRKEGKPMFDLNRENYELALCDLDLKEKFKFGDGYLLDPFFRMVAIKEKTDSYEILMDEVFQKTGERIAGKSLMRINNPNRLFLEIEQIKLSVDEMNSIVDSDKNILFFDVRLSSLYEDFIRLGGCLYKSPQKAVLTPAHEKNLLNIVFEGDDIEPQCKKHVLSYKFIER